MSVLMNTSIRDILIIFTLQDTPLFQDLLGDISLLTNCLKKRLNAAVENAESGTGATVVSSTSSMA